MAGLVWSVGDILLYIGPWGAVPEAQRRVDAADITADRICESFRMTELMATGYLSPSENCPAVFQQTYSAS